MLYYTVSHNVSDDGSERTSDVHTVDIQLKGAEPGQTYYIVVYAVNVVGKGLLAARVIVTGEPCIVRLSVMMNIIISLQFQSQLQWAQLLLISRTTLVSIPLRFSPLKVILIIC